MSNKAHFGKGLFFFIYFTFSASILLAEVNQNGDFQFWNFWSLDKALKNKYGLRFVGEGRWGDNVSRLYLVYAQAQIVYTDKWLEIAPGYRQEYNNTSLKWRSHRIPMGDITVTLSNKWELSDRNRMLYYMQADTPSFLVYRNRLRLISPELSSIFKIKTFIDDEVFFRQKDGFHQNRLSVGFFGSASTVLKGRMFYMYRSLKQNNQWTYQNVLAVQLYFYF